MALRGWDLATLWRQRRWRFLLNIIDHLPRDSYYVAAIATDEELAQQAPEPKPSAAPSLTEWSAEVERLTLIADRLGELITAVINTAVKKPRKPPRALPRPVTAYDRIKARKRRATHELIKNRLRQAATTGRPTMAQTAPADPQYTAFRSPGRHNPRPQE